MQISRIVAQHLDEADILFLLRTTLRRAPHINLRNLGRVDARLDAHLDALSMGGDEFWRLCEASLDAPTAGVLFTASVRAVDDRQNAVLDTVLGIAESTPGIRSGLFSAFGWLSTARLQGIVANLLTSANAFRRLVGIVACAMHRVDPGIVTAPRLTDEDLEVRTRAIRTAGETGCLAALPTLTTSQSADNPVISFWRAWSSVLLGNRAAALDVLRQTGLTSGDHRTRSFRLSLQAMSSSLGREYLRELATDRSQLRLLIEGSGIAGDVGYVLWLIDHMRDDKSARLAGEAFSLITGADLGEAQIDRPRPEEFESGPTDNPEDENVEMDPDEGLPWPDANKIEKWWNQNVHRFQEGRRYFMGAPVTREHCIDVLKNGYQRQRILAAHYLCLLDPGTPLFNTSAPAWRQQRLLARM